MTPIAEFALLGAALGALYALTGLGLVMVYRGSGVINFAAGGMGMAGMLLYHELRDIHGWPSPIAIVLGVAFSALIGFLTYLLVMRPLRGASQLVKVVGTVAILIVIDSIASIRYSSSVYTSASLLGNGSIKFSGLSVPVDRTWIFGIGLILTCVFTVVYRRTKFGLATSAVSESPGALATLGRDPDRVAALNWTLGAAVSGLAGVLLAAIQGIDISQAPLVVAPALAAAVIGSFRSFPLTFVGALVVGILEAEATRYIKVQGASDALPFLVIVAIMIFRGRGLPFRDYVVERLPRVTGGQVHWYRVIAFVVIAGVLFDVWLSPVWLGAIATTLVTGIILLSVVVLTGFTGQLSLAQYAVAGVIGVIAARMIAAGVPTVLAVVLAILCAVPLGMALGLPSLRARGLTLAIVTLGFNIAIISLVLQSVPIAGGADGIDVGNLSFFGVSFNPVLHPQRFTIFVLACFAAVACAVANLRRGRVGRRLLAVRSNERAAAALGVNVAEAKLGAFGLSTAIAGFGGIIAAISVPVPIFTSYSPFDSVLALAYAVIGGVGFPSGPLLGGSLQSGAVGSQILNSVAHGYEQYIVLAGGVLLLFTLLRAPDGLVPMNVRDFQRLAARVSPKISPRLRSGPAKPAFVLQPVTPDEGAPRAGRRLEVHGLTVRFANVVAVNDVSLSVNPGEVLGIIGPNGAGKTSIVDAICGFVTAHGGEIVLGSDNLSGQSPYQRARRGIGRSFQSLELFEDMTVLENVLVASEPRDHLAWVTDLVRPRPGAVNAAARQAIADAQIEECLAVKPDELPYGMRRMVALARTIAADPEVLILDEPAAGLDLHQRQDLRALIVHQAKERGRAVVLIEHDVSLVAECADRILAMDFGQLVAEGTPADVLAHVDVVASYLGRSGATT